MVIKGFYHHGRRVFHKARKALGTDKLHNHLKKNTVYNSVHNFYKKFENGLESLAGEALSCFDKEIRSEIRLKEARSYASKCHLKAAKLGCVPQMGLFFVDQSNKAQEPTIIAEKFGVYLHSYTPEGNLVFAYDPNLAKHRHPGVHQNIHPANLPYSKLVPMELLQKYKAHSVSLGTNDNSSLLEDIKF